MAISIDREDLPALYRSADAASREAQGRYLRLLRSDLFLVILGATLTAASVSNEALRGFLAILGAIVLAGGLLLTGLIGSTGLYGSWFAARAVAESAKTVAWRFVTCAEPFLNSMAPEEAERLLCERLNEVLHGRIGIASELGGMEAAGAQITAAMRALRAASLEVRKQTYLRDRIQNQRTWYANKARDNSESSSRWLVATALVQFLSVVAAISLVRFPTIPINMASVLSAVAAAFIAWLQVKQHQGLAHAYGLAAHELGLIEPRVARVTAEAQFAEFVADAENAISREHTMWTARRDVPC